MTGVARRDEDRAAGGVAPEQGALRPLQNLHGFQIGQVEHRAGLAGDIDPIDIYGDIRFRASTLHAGADAAHGGLQICAGLVDDDARCLAREVVHAVDAGAGQLLAADRYDGCGHVYQTLLAPLCGDDDVGIAIGSHVCL